MRSVAWERIAAAAAGRFRAGEELGSRVARGQAREGKWADARATCASLFKTSKKPDFLCRVAALALVEASGDEASLALRLADRMLEKALDAKGGAANAAAEDVELLVRIRRTRGDAAGALACVRETLAALPEAPGGDVRRPLRRDLRLDEASLLREAGDDAAAQKAYVRRADHGSQRGAAAARVG